MVSIDNEPDYIFKLVILGDSGVGKSSLMVRYVSEIFQDEWSNTIGVDFRLKKIEKNNEKINLHIWDTAGSSRFNNYFKSYLRQAQGIILVYDCTDEESLLGVKSISDYVSEFVYEGAKKVLVGNKCDRKDKVVEKFRGEELARELQAGFFETSAKDDINVNEMFEYLIYEIRNWIQIIGNNSGSLIPKIKQKERKELCI